LKIEDSLQSGKVSFLKYQCEWLSQKKTILLKCNHNISEKIMESDHRGRPKVDFSMSSRSKRRRLAELAKIDETAVSALLNEFKKYIYIIASRSD